MVKFSILTFLREQRTTIPISNVDISDKSIVVTGANVGLGLEAAIHLAKLKPKRLLLTTRNEAKGKQAKQDMQQQSVMEDIKAWPLELGSFDSVRNFADRVELEGFPMNVFIANAAVSVGMTYSKTQDGWETTLQVNYLSTALLSILMLPHLIKSSTPTNASRLVIVSSEGHYLANKLIGVASWPSILEKLSDEAYCTISVMMNRYELSKRVMFVRELASRLPSPTPVSVLATHPGFCYSRLTRSIENNLLFNIIVRKTKALLARTTEMGSRTIVHPAVESGEREWHGRYLSSCKVTEESDYVLSKEGKEISKRLWTETVEVLKKIDPRVNQVVSEHLQEP